jgi:hypothetical protein
VQAAEKPAGLGVRDADRQGWKSIGMAAALHAVVALVALVSPVGAESLTLERFDMQQRWVEAHLVPKETPANPFEVPDLPEAGDGGETEAAAEALTQTPVKSAEPPSPLAPPKGDGASREEKKEYARTVAGVASRAIGAEVEQMLGDALGAEAHAALENLDGGVRGEMAALTAAGRPYGMPGGRPGGKGFTSGPIATRGPGTRPGTRWPTGTAGERTPKKPERIPQVVMKKPIVEGGLTKDEVRRVIRAHLNEYKYCYERRLIARPDLMGKIVMSFMIGQSGGVIAAKPVEDSTGDKAIGHCVAKRMLRWQFPPPRGGGMVTVRYPFIFKSS